MKYNLRKEKAKKTKKLFYCKQFDGTKQSLVSTMNDDAVYTFIVFKCAVLRNVSKLKQLKKQTLKFEPQF